MKSISSWGFVFRLGEFWVKLLRLFTAETGILREKDGRERGREGEGSREPRGAEWWGRKCTRVERISRVDDTAFHLFQGSPLPNASPPLCSSKSFGRLTIIIKIIIIIIR